MNIPVLTSSGKVIVRPDTTWEKDNEDLYLPEVVSAVDWTPVVFARISRPGRSIASKFADRYFDAIGYGVLLYLTDFLDGSEEGFAEASCLDHTSFLPFPLFNKMTLGEEANRFELTKGEELLFCTVSVTPELLFRAVETVSARVYLRTGDLVAAELQSRKPLCKRGEETPRIRGTYCNNPTIDFKIIM